MSERTSVLDNKYDIQAIGRSLSIRVTRGENQNLNKIPSVLEANFLNTWIQSRDEPDGVILEHTLQNFDQTLADTKAGYSSDIDSFKDKMIPVLQSVLKFLLFMESGKQWDTPLDPINLIYNQQTGNTQAFYRKPEPIEYVDSEWMDRVDKLLIYLFTPEPASSAQRITKDYYRLSGNDIGEYLDGDELATTYGSRIDDNNDFIFSIVGSEYNYSSVREILNSLADINEGNSLGNEYRQIIREVDVTKGVVELSDVRDLSQYQNEPDEEEEEEPEEKDPRDMTPTERREYYKEQAAQRKAAKKAKKGGGFGKFLIAIIVLGIIGGGAYFLLAGSGGSGSGQQNSASSSNSAKSPKDDPNFQKGIQAAAASDYAGASSDFDKYFSSGGTQNSLSNDQIAAVFGAYYKSGNYQDILDNIGSDKTVKALVNGLYADNKSDTVTNLKSSNNYLKIAQADKSGDNDTLTSLASQVDESNNKFIQKDIASAFVKTNKLDDGKTWAQSQSNSQDLMNAMKAEALSQPNADQNKINSTFS